MNKFFLIFSVVYLFHQSAFSFCTDCVRFTVGRPIVVTGPHHEIPDNKVQLINNGSEGVLGYVGNQRSYRLTGTRADTVQLESWNPAIGPGSATFDSCGSWIQPIEKTSSGALLAWYHAEGACNRKSISLAVSYDGGHSFGKYNYPNSQVIKAGYNLTDSSPGPGDHTVIRDGNYRYLYYINPSPNSNGQPGPWHTSVARSGTWTWGGPGQWFNYLNTTFSSPGIGGGASKLGNFGSSASKYVNGNEKQVMLLNTNGYTGGIQLTLGDIPKGPFASLEEPLVPTDSFWWTGRNSSAGELIAYPSVSHLNGGNEWSNQFVLFYLYIKPGEDFTKRYLVRRHVWVQKSSSPLQTQVKLNFSRYVKPNGSDTWDTTSPAMGFWYKKSHGYLMTAPHPQLPTKKLMDCYSNSTNNHLTEVGTCSSGHKKLRTLGYIFNSSQPNTDPLYRCYNINKSNHFLSTSAQCEGHNNNFKMLLGYIEKN